MRRRRAPVFLASGVALLVAGAAAGPKVALPEEPLLRAPGYRAQPVYADSGQQYDDARWLGGGDVPGGATAWAEMARWALVDIRSQTSPNGAVAAGPGRSWQYFWPRDGSFAAVALARSDHRAEASRVLDRLSGLEFDDAVGFQARYGLDGSPRRDRPRQSDGCGWVLWAVAEVRAEAPAAVPPSADRLRDRCVATLTRLVAQGHRLPPASPDYWEVAVDRTTLGTVAPMVAGLLAASRDYSLTGDARAARRTREVGDALAAVVVRGFGPRFERFGDTGGLDAAVLLLLPPFLPAGELPADSGAALDSAVHRYAREALQPAGGLAPGVDWVKHDGSSWTPETALLALTAAATGHRERAGDLLDWLDAHRTSYGSLPEKVTRTGRPAGPAPLIWTASLVVLTLSELERH
ncbi:glycoside hydrolase family 15 [Pedococcus sp. 5OH_020]|uniref:glycoside hydrolase family 15 n=1 Tax=Pedococcus sp. 5OH_020 TaxID=2989814 RepID=UPI0022E9AC79|nr:glycoside hydrolase family 15 [Pedococcus sp. 5OH_020]